MSSCKRAEGQKESESETKEHALETHVGAPVLLPATPPALFCQASCVNWRKDVNSKCKYGQQRPYQ